MTNQDRAGGVLLGKVTIAGEMLPWEPISVIVNCQGTMVYTTETDPKGEFAVAPSSVPGDVSQLGDAQRQMKTHYEGCVLEGDLTGFRSTKLTITEHNLRDDPEVGTIVLSRDSTARETAMSATSLSAPPAAAKSYTKAGSEMLVQKPERAQKELEKAVREYPNFADAWYQLGRLQVTSAPGIARLCLEKAIQIDPNFVRPYGQLAALAVQAQDWRAALQSAGHSLELEPRGTIWVWYYSALANFQLGRLDAAEMSANKLVAMDPLHNVRGGEQLLAAVLARKADYNGALAHLRNCLTYIRTDSDISLLKQEIAQLEQKVNRSN